MIKYSVQIIDKASKEVVEKIPCNGERDAQTVLQGVQINLNRAEFRAEISMQMTCEGVLRHVESNHTHKQE